MQSAPVTTRGGNENETNASRRRAPVAALDDGHGRDRRRVDGAVRRQLPDRDQERHGRLRQDARRRRPADRGRAATTSPSSSTRSTTSSPPASTRSSSTRSTPRRPRRCRTRPPAGGIPLVYVNREPINVDTLPDNQAFVASDERESGTLETKEVCRLFKEAGKTEANVYVIMGELSNQAAQQRTQDILDVIGAGECGVKINIIDKQTSNWMRDEAQNLMTNWLSTGAAVRRGDRQQRRERHRRDPGDEGRRHRHEAAGHRRGRRHPGRAAGDAGGRARRDRVPGRGRPGPGRRSTRR